MAEQDILLKLRQKDPKGVELMIDAYGVIVYKLVARILQDLGREDIEECCSDVFLAAWNKSNQFDPERGSMRTWLLMLARYTALDYRRRFAKEKAVQNAKLWEFGSGGKKFISRMIPPGTIF